MCSQDTLPIPGPKLFIDDAAEVGIYKTRCPEPVSAAKAVPVARHVATNP
jgi:hypothetical protein